MVNIAGLPKVQVLKVLWENSKAQGMSFLHLPASGEVTEGECMEALTDTNYNIDYFAGKVIKVNLKEDNFDPWGYDRDNGEGAAQRAVDSLLK